MMWKAERPNRNQLCGMSPSQFKTMLKRKGYKVGRDFFKMAAVAYNTKFRGINLKEPGDPCWENYEMIGMKDDGTPNCVPIKE